MEDFVMLLSPLAPHLAEELWSRLGHTETLAYAPWPEFQEALTVDNEVEIVVQVNGKIKDRLIVAKGTEQDTMKENALALEAVQEALQGKQVRKFIVVPDRLVNIVVG